MINVKELRIGNFIMDDDGMLAKINGFNPFDHSIRCDEAEGCVICIDVYHELTSKWMMGREADSPECNPIPLTPEWLERCGFLQMEYKYYDGSTAEAFVQKGKRYIIRSMDFKDVSPYYAMAYFPYAQSQNSIPSELRYVHQLQNLYFALTGEELTINNVNLQSAS